LALHFKKVNALEPVIKKISLYSMQYILTENMLYISDNLFIFKEIPIQDVLFKVFDNSVIVYISSKTDYNHHIFITYFEKKFLDDVVILVLESNNFKKNSFKHL
jgi:hypothetical protein